jgi:transketolase
MTMDLRKKADWVRRELLQLHSRAPETRIASSLSPVEALTALFYGGVMKFDPRNPRWEGRDRFIASKGHGCVALYPILADLGFIAKDELATVCKPGSRLGGIPDAHIPGVETTNGSLGHGLGVGCGMALGLRQRRTETFVYTLLGDGEACEGAVWEAVMFAGQQRLENLVLILDANGVAMLDYTRNIINLEPFDQKFRDFGWEVTTLDGHDPVAIHDALVKFRPPGLGRPKAIIARTVKGKGVPHLETDAMSHIKTLKPEQIAAILGPEE